MFHSVSLFSQAPLARGSRALPSILLDVSSSDQYSGPEHTILLLDLLDVSSSDQYSGPEHTILLLDLLDVSSSDQYSGPEHTILRLD